MGFWRGIFHLSKNYKINHKIKVEIRENSFKLLLSDIGRMHNYNFLSPYLHVFSKQGNAILEVNYL
jgi:hypothetical protein